MENRGPISLNRTCANVARMAPRAAWRGVMAMLVCALYLGPISSHPEIGVRAANAQDTVRLRGALTRFVQTPRVKPAAPGPRYLNPADYTRLKTLRDLLDRKQWNTARNLIATLDDPDARSLGQWYYFYRRDPNVALTQATEFLDGHGDWPALSRIQRHAEAQLDDDTPSAKVYALFKTRDPITGSGKRYFLRALMARGDVEAAQIYLRDSWRNHRFSISDERRLLSDYGNWLTPQDHIAKVDHLLWARQVTNARRHFNRLPARARRLAQARAAFYVRASNAERLYRALPAADQRDPGVLHAAIRYYRRGDNQDRAIALVRSLPDDPKSLRNPARFWDERNLLMRWALKNGRFMDAYEMANAHGLDDGLDLADAEFNAGWIALRFLQEPARAEAHFTALAGWATSPISTARAYYWLGRAAAARGETALANSRYGVAARFIFTYYGQLAAEEIGGAVAARKFVPTATISPRDRAAFDDRRTARAFRMISDLNDRNALLIFSYHLDDRLESPGEYLLLSEITAGEDAPHLTIRAGKTAVRKQKLIPELSYPILSVPERAARFVAPEVIMGLSRQESEFNPRAYSRAGARGVMQLLPSTAQITARKERIAYSRDALLSDAAYNITIGSAHLSHLLDRFDGSFIMTFVGYNAGPHRATRWVEEYGDPRTEAVDAIDWVELIPFSETRNYVQRVHENIQIYRARINDRAIAGGLSRDLIRGGSGLSAPYRKRPSLILDAKRPATDKRALPPLSKRTASRIANAPLDMPAARARADHLAPRAVPPVSPPSPSIAPDSAAPAPAVSPPAPTAQPAAVADAPTVTPASPDSPSVSTQKAAPSAVTVTVSKGSAPDARPSAPGDLPAPVNLDNDGCASYRAFVARNNENEARAAQDLNAAMLAELRGGTTCPPGVPSDKPLANSSGPATNTVAPQP